MTDSPDNNPIAKKLTNLSEQKVTQRSRWGKEGLVGSEGGASTVEEQQRRDEANNPSKKTGWLGRLLGRE